MGLMAEKGEVSTPLILPLRWVSRGAWGSPRKTRFVAAPEFFFWQPTAGHTANFKVIGEVYGTNVGQQQTTLAHGWR